MVNETGRTFEALDDRTAMEEEAEPGPPSSLVPASTVLSYTSSAPRLYNPFRSEANPHIHEAADHSTRWMVEFAIVGPEPADRRFEGSKFAALSALAYPTCSAESLKIANDWCIWLFAWDDCCDRTELGKSPESLKQVHDRYLEVLDGAEPSPEAPLERALADLRRRMLAKDAGPWFGYFRAAVSDYFDACVWEAGNRRRGEPPPRAEYLRWRLASGAVFTAFELFNLTDELDLPDNVRNDQRFRDLTRAANNVICWSNDIYSLDRELQKGDVHNLVIIMMQREGLSRAEAIAHAVRMHDAEVHKYRRVELALRSFGPGLDEKIRKYCQLMRAWMCANGTWSQHTRRYNAPRAQRTTLVPPAAT
jgi:5-epi-alpha-selinene synthase